MVRALGVCVGWMALAAAAAAAPRALPTTVVHTDGLGTLSVQVQPVLDARQGARTAWTSMAYAQRQEVSEGVRVDRVVSEVEYDCATPGRQRRLSAAFHQHGIEAPVAVLAREWAWHDLEALPAHRAAWAAVCNAR